MLCGCPIAVKGKYRLTTVCNSYSKATPFLARLRLKKQNNKKNLQLHAKYCEWYILLLLPITTCRSCIRALLIQLYKVEDVTACAQTAGHATLTIITGSLSSQLQIAQSGILANQSGLLHISLLCILPTSGLQNVKEKIHFHWRAISSLFTLSIIQMIQWTTQFVICH